MGGWQTKRTSSLSLVAHASIVTTWKRAPLEIAILHLLSAGLASSHIIFRFIKRAMAPKVTLHYFNSPDRAEPIRWILAYGAGDNWVDHRVEGREWPAMKATTPYGSLPYIEVDGKTLGQSYAIMRYLAKQNGLVGKDDWENAQIDAVADYIGDASQGYNAYSKAQMGNDQAGMKKAAEEYTGTTIKPFLAKFERMLQENKSGQDFLVGKKPSWADFLLARMMDKAMPLKSDLLEPYPLLKAHNDRVHNLKGIKEYIQKHGM